MKYFYNTLQELKYYQQLELRTQKEGASQGKRNACLGFHVK